MIRGFPRLAPYSWMSEGQFGNSWQTPRVLSAVTHSSPVENSPVNQHQRWINWFKLDNSEDNRPKHVLKIPAFFQTPTVIFILQFPPHLAQELEPIVKVRKETVKEFNADSRATLQLWYLGNCLTIAQIPWSQFQGSSMILQQKKLFLSDELVSLESF